MLLIMSALAGRFVLLGKSQQKGTEMSKQALVVKAELVAELIDIASDELNKLQKAVDGLIEAVDILPNVTMWVNEEGLLREDLEVNYLATAFMQELFHATTPIMGDVVFTGAPDDEGNTKPLTQADVAELTELTRKAKEALYI